MRRFSWILLIMALTWFLSGCKYSWELEDAQNLDDEIVKEMEAKTIPSIAACIIKNDEVVWKQAYGKADRENNVEASTATVYTLMSVSKVVIATAAMQLVDRGVLDLDADINNYLPFPVRNPYFPGRMITPRMLLTHTSSLVRPDGQIPDMYVDCPDDSAPPLREWLKEYFTDHDQYGARLWQNRAPGQIEEYSNLGSALMAYVVEAISGTEYNDYCKKKIFQPLDMPNTSHFIKDLDAATLAIPYQVNYQRLFHINHRDYPGGWLRSPIDEFAHFVIATMNGGAYNGKRILSESSVNEMLRIQNQATGMCLIWSNFAFYWYGKDGSGTGFQAMVDFHKQDRVGFIIFANSSKSPEDTYCTVCRGGKIYGLIKKEAGKY